MAIPFRLFARVFTRLVPLVSVALCVSQVGAQTISGWVSGSNHSGQLGVASVATNPTASVTLDTGVVSAAVGAEHTLWIKTDGTLWAMGGNASGQLGAGDVADRHAPVQIAADVAAVAAGRAHTLILKTDGTLWAAGDNAYGQLGLGDTSDRLAPAQLASDVASVAAGDDHTLFIKTDGSLWSVGRNDRGQLGDTTTADRSVPAQIATGVARAAGGVSHTLFVKTNGSLWACSESSLGRLGNGATSVGTVSTPVQIVASGVSSAAAGSAHSLFLKTDGTLWTMGFGQWGQLFTGFASIRSSPGQVATGVAAIAAGVDYSLYRKTDGTLWGAGRNQLRELGGASIAPVFTARQLASGVGAVVSKNNHAVYLATDGTLHGLGDNRAGQLGQTPSATLAPASADEGVVAISQGIAHALFLKADGTLWAAGDNTYGQLGTGDNLPRTAAVQIAAGVASVSAGSWHTLYLKTDGTLWATGRNDRGQLGNGSTSNLTAAVQITTGVIAISAGGQHSLFVKKDATLWGMGDNSYRQINTGASSLVTPSLVAQSVSVCAAGGAHSFWISSGTLYATGNNDFGQLGTGTTFTIPNSSPSFYVVATGVAAVSSAYSHTLFVKNNGTLWAMGSNASGQLGDGTTTPRLSPVQIATGVAKIAVGGLADGLGGSHSHFAKTDGTRWAMGDNRFGQLGDGTRETRLAPVAVSGGPVSDLSAGDTFSAFIQSVPVAPSVTAQPASQTIDYGDYARLSVAAAGGFLSHQWYLGESGDTSRPVVGATSDGLLTLPVVEPGSYWVRITNGLGSIDSAAAAVAPRPRISGMVSGAGALDFGVFGESLATSRVGVPMPLAADIAFLAHSSNHTLILKHDGTLWGVGQNSLGQLGLGDTTARTSPVQIASSVAACAVGSTHSLFLKTDGTLWGMGGNSYGQLGDASTTNRSLPIQIATSVQTFAAGGSHTMFVKTDGTLWATGRNSSGQLGNGATTDLSLPAQIATGVAVVTAGSSHSLFLRAEGTLWATGANAAGQLGDGTLVSRSTPVLVADGVFAISANAQGTHGLFLKTDGQLFGMGENSFGNLGLGDTADRAVPSQIDTGVIACSAGANHSLWIKAEGSLWTTGNDDFGQLGLGAVSNQLLPREVAVGVTRACATAYSSWFVVGDGAMRGMGRNHAGQLGSALVDFSSFVAMADSVTSVDAMLTSQPESRLLGLDGRIWSSLGTPYDADTTPGFVAADVVRVIDVPLFKSTGGTELSGDGPERLLFLCADGTLWGAGDNTYGALGLGDTVARTEPVQIAAGVVDAATTLYGTTFLKSDGTLWTVGLARALGGGGAYSFGFSPVQLDSEVQAISGGILHVLYLKKDGGLWGFGDNAYTQLGSRTQYGAVVSTPKFIAADVARFVAGQRHSFLIQSDGTLLACGSPIYGQLGVSGSSSGVALTQVTNSVAEVVTTAETSFMLKTDGSVWAVGQNGFGQLGLGATTLFTTFTRLQAGSPGQYLSNVRRVVPAVSGEATFFLKTDGSLWGAGRNDRGQLGLGHTNVVNRPVLVRAQAYDVSASGVHTLVLHEPTDVAAPVIVTQPAGQTVAFGDFASMSVGASGTDLLTYQWYQGAAGDTTRPIAGADFSTLRLPAFAGSASYWVRVANAAGSADSAAATITVNGAGSAAFRAWAEGRGLSGSRLSIFADGDRDGVANLLEYAFATAPETTDGRGSFAPELVRLPEGDFLVLTHRRRKATDANLSYERSADLQIWEEVALTPTVVEADADGDCLVEEVAVALPIGAETSRQFLRVKASQP